MSAPTSRLGATPWKFQGITGRRKGTSIYCPTCGDWHPTELGIGTAGCPNANPEDRASTAVYIPRERLGTQRKRVRIPFRVEGVTH